MIDVLYRVAYWLGYRAARLLWRWTKPRVRGALVAVHHEGRLLLVKTSYRLEWSMPGGGIGPGETPAQAAVRELREEIGWTIEAAELRPRTVIDLEWHGRRDEVTFFDLDVQDLQPIRVDRREVVRALFVSPAEALSMPLQEHIRHLLHRPISDEI